MKNFWLNSPTQLFILKRKGTFSNFGLKHLENIHASHNVTHTDLNFQNTQDHIALLTLFSLKDTQQFASIVCILDFGCTILGTTLSESA